VLSVFAEQAQEYVLYAPRVMLGSLVGGFAFLAVLFFFAIKKLDGSKKPFHLQQLKLTGQKLNVAELEQKLSEFDQIFVRRISLERCSLYECPKGLLNFHNVTSLNLRDNNIPDISMLNQLKSLGLLNVSKNKIQSFNLTRLKKLRHINLLDNPLEKKFAVVSNSFDETQHLLRDAANYFDRGNKEKKFFCLVL
jgi:Leucine-rich repeat (LRR) protein